MSKRAQTIELRIEELVLHGSDLADRHQIGDAIVSELTRLLEDGAASSVVAVSRDIPRLDGGDYVIPVRSSPGTIGSEIARAVVNGLIQ